MNITSMTTKRRIKNIALAACAVMATATMAAGDLAAQCRVGSGNSGYGYGGNNSGYGFGGLNSGYGNSYTNGRGFNVDGFNNRNLNSRNLNSRFNSGYDRGYGQSGYRGLSNQRPSLPLGLTFNGNRNTGYNNDRYSNRSSFGNSFYTNTRQPVSYRNADRYRDRNQDRFGSGYGQNQSPFSRLGL